MSRLREFHRKNSFEYISFLICNLISKIEKMESVIFIEDYLDDRYYRECHFSKTIGEFANEYPYGKYAVTTNGHITCSKPDKNGIPTIYDTFDPRDREVEDVWIVK